MMSLWLFNVFMDIRNACGNVNDISVWSVNEQVFLNVDDNKLLACWFEVNVRHSVIQWGTWNWKYIKNQDCCSWKWTGQLHVLQTNGLVENGTMDEYI